MTDTIRKYQPQDLPSCRTLWTELTQHHRDIYQIPTIGGPNPGTHFDKHLAKVGPDNLWVATHQDTVIALTGLMGTGDQAEVEPAIVSQPHRRRGIGKTLMETVIAEAKNRGIKTLSVRPVARNHEALNFFTQQGFTNVGHIELFIDLTNRQWKKGLKLFDLELKY
jgi:N-acetylglutamate synthase-like GNAT family acetyltransferase